MGHLRIKASGTDIMRIFLTGAGGFIGSHLQTVLSAAGHHVTSHSLSVDGPIEEIPKDIDIAVNSAGKLGGDGFTENELVEANLNVVKRMCDSCRRRGIHLIHLSTPGVAGTTANGKESDPFNPGGAYESTKADAEKYISLHLPEASILRPDFVFGEGDMHKFPLFRQTAKGWFPLVGNGSSRTRPTDVRDVCEAVLQAFPGKPLEKGTWNIGGPDVLTVKELVKTIAHVLDLHVKTVPIPRILFRIILNLGPFRPKALSESRYKLFGTDRFTCLDKTISVGFSPEFSFRQTAETAVEWYRERGLL